MIPKIVCASDPDFHEIIINEAIVNRSVPNHYVFRIKPEKNELLINQIRDIQRVTAYSSVSIRIFVLYAFDMASAEVQNSLLKTLEEKSENNLFIMLCTSLDRILSTIKSRSAIIESKKNDREKAANIEVFMDELRNSKGYSFISSPLIQKPTKESAIALIEACVYYLRRKMIEGKHGYSHIIRRCIDKKELILNNNLNPQLAVDSLLIEIRKHFVS